MTGLRRGARRRAEAGQTLVEFALILPLFLLLVLGLVELSYLLLDQHVVTRLTREGSNLTSRDTSLQDAVTAMRRMSARPVNFDDGSSRLILSVIKRVSTIGASNYNKDVLYQRVEYGAYAAQSALQMRGAGGFGPAPDYIANNSDNDTSLQVTGLPSNLLTLGGMVYVTEIYSNHPLITPLGSFGVHAPNRVYSIAYF